MKLLHIKDQNEQYVIPAIDGILIDVHSFDVQKQWGSLQKLVDHIAKHDFDGVILSTRLGGSDDYWGLEFCMRWRLSYSSIRDKAFKTLFVFAESSVEEIIKEQIELKAQPTGTVLLTKGIFVFDSLDYFDLVATSTKNYDTLNEENFKTTFLDVIKVNRPPDFGNHSLANLLGAIRLAEITGNKNAISSNSAIIEKREDLYVKYKTEFRRLDSETFPKKEIPSQGKNILLVDDKENFGWTDILKRVFKDACFDYVSAGENFIQRAEKKALEDVDNLPKWDLILLDLRLEDKEDKAEMASKHAGSYSGANLIEKIKDKNRGIQVMVFTASNKAWNLKQLLDAPFYIDGYFIKESLGSDYNLSFSMANYLSFENNVRKCFDNVYLKKIWQSSMNIQNAFKKNPLTKRYFQTNLPAQINGMKYQNLLITEIDSMFEILHSQNTNRYNHAMLMLYKVLEYINEIFFKKVSKEAPPEFYDRVTLDYFDKNSKAWKKATDKVSFYNRSTKTNEFSKIKLEWLKSTSNKVLNLAYKKLKITDNSIFDNLIVLSDCRNDFIHSDTTKRNKLKTISQLDILNWLTAIEQIIVKI